MNPEPDSSDDISGIILGAGLSSRMKKTKQLLLYKNKPLLQHVLQSARESSLGKIIVVLGHDMRKILKIIDFSGAEVVINKSYQTGQGSSIKAGLSAVPQHHQAALFLLGDQPFVTPRVVKSVIQSFLTSRAPIVIPTTGGKRGNPVLFSRALFKDLVEVSGDIGGRALFEQYKESIGTIEVDDKGILFDINTPEDYEFLISGNSD